MSRDLDDLTADFRGVLDDLLENCRRRGVEMRPFFTLRNVVEQAALWRQSRSSQEVETEIARLEAADAQFLAQALRDAGPQSGRWATNAIPGYSWHQWGEAVDCFWLVDGKAEWSARRQIDGQNGYEIYANEAERLGLTAGGHWKTAKDWPHVQLQGHSSPGAVFTLAQINAAMRERFA